ncbi:HEAT repeat domain-containing protein [Flavobacterium sp. LC2016-12]|uniref:HEAT repeat domain-containing protein n=1 Tax=Flavobacterium sp. LC2016-12 TaxID=2783794 RepID=UPI00188BAB4C|nr:hypothetical protein [Flavobacterium sp. LC2016-12]MBF4463794.1 hypothetical protein [Flavobacterium sp. LC2016-12]
MEKLIEIIKHFVIPFFFILSLSLIVILLLKRIYYQYNLPYRHQIIRKSEIFLTEITLSKPDKNTLKYKIAKFKSEIPIHKTWCKEMLICDMIRMKSNLKGKTAKNILLIYKELDLNHYSASLIRDFRKYKKCEGIYHFQALGYKPGISILKNYLFHRNKIIRSNANIAYLALSKGDWQAVDKLRIKNSIITTIKVMDVLHSEKIPQPKQLDLWIQAKNPTILKLAVMTMVFYNYRNKAAEIIKLLHHEDKALKIDAITAIQDLFLIEAEDEILALFYNEPIEIQLEMLEALAEIGSKKTIDFLKIEIPKQEVKDLKLKMVCSLDSLDSEALNALGKKDSDTQKMINHNRKLEL